MIKLIIILVISFLLALTVSFVLAKKFSAPKYKNSNIEMWCTVFTKLRLCLL